MTPLASDLVDRDQPWPGLSTFTEAHRAYFFGRDEETRELLRKVERRTLTVLFGQSGLGKSSLLQAGVFPKLRESGVWPIYVRLDHGVEAAPLAEQIKTFVSEATAEAGTWSRPGSATPGETLWEFFHHRDDVLTGKDGKPVVPLLVFDQFEEVFTLGATSEAARKRADVFIEQFADLIENRPPADFDARIDAGTTNGDDFDHTRADYRILIALREDYLPHLESLKQRIPSLMQNRMRLTRLRAENAMEAVLKPAPGVVSEDVARSIVAYVAGRTNLSDAEVEPALLSLVCRELNTRRLAKGEAVISADLLEGSRDMILTEFYERCVAPHPPAIREFIEDELLTDSGYRENIALERAQKALRERGADAKALDALVASRLLRIEERLDLRRIELTHDVLCSVVRASREQRRQRLEQERLAAESRAQKKRLWWARGVAAGLVVVIGFVSLFAVRTVRERNQERIQAARVDLEFSTRQLESGHTREGVAALIRAYRADPDNRILSTRLISALAESSFPVVQEISGVQLPPLRQVYVLEASDEVLAVADQEVLLLSGADFSIKWRTPISGNLHFIRTPKTESSFAVLQFSGKAQALDLKSGKLNVLALEENESAALVETLHSSLSPDGKLWAINCWKGKTAHNTRIKVFDLTGRIAPRYVGGGDLSNVSALAFSNDATSIGVSDWDLGVTAFDCATGARKVPWSKTPSAASVVWSYDGETLFAPTWLGITEVVAVDGSGQASSTNANLDTRLLSPLAAQRGVLGWDGGFNLIRYSLPKEGHLSVTGTIVAAQALTRLELGGDDDTVVGVSASNELGVWQFSTGRPLFEPNLRIAGDFGFSLDERHARIVLALSNGLLATRSLLAQPLTTARTTFRTTRWEGVQVPPGVSRGDSEEGQTFYVSGGGEFRKYSAQSLKEIPSVDLKALNLISAFVHPESNTMIGWDEAATVYAMKRNSDGTIERVTLIQDLKVPGTSWKFPFNNPYCLVFNRTEVRVFDVTRFAFVGDAFDCGDLQWGCVSIDKGGERLVAGGVGLRVWDVPGRRILWKRETAYVLGVSISPDGRTVAAVTSDLKLTLYRASDGTQIGASLVLGRGVFNGGNTPEPRFDPAGRYVVWGGNDGHIFVVTTADAAPVELPILANQKVGGFDFVQGDYLAVIESGRISVWDVVSGVRIQQFGKGPYWSGFFSDDCKWAISSTVSGQIEVRALPPLSNAPAPEWLIDLARGMSGYEYGAKGTLVPVSDPFDLLERVRKHLSTAHASDPLAHWARWLLSDPQTRPLSPNSLITAAEATRLGWTLSE
ncbi:MAG: hypothetical protein SFV32_00405 [Opitutaceae bacterium]|nr:hypothetical protein [Opitutaceae bacterium]